MFCCVAGPNGSQEMRLVVSLNSQEAKKQGWEKRKNNNLKTAKQLME